MLNNNYFNNNFMWQKPSFGNSFAPTWNMYSQGNSLGNWNAMNNWNSFSGTNSFSNWGTPTWGESAFNQVSAGSSASSVNTENLSPDEIEALQKKERAEKVKSVIEKEQALEIETTGLGVTKSDLRQIKDVAVKKIEDESKGVSLGEEIAYTAALPAIGAVGITPFTNGITYFAGEHNNLFSKATDIYNSGHSYGEVFKQNSKIMNDAKAAMRKADKYCNIKRKGRLDRSLYDEMAKDMKNVLKQLAADPNNAAAQQKLKDLTASINQITSQRVGRFTSWRKNKMNRIRSCCGRPTVPVNQPNISTYNAAKQAQAAATQAVTTQAAQTGAQTASKGLKLFKGCGKLLKIGPLLSVAIEAFTDYPKVVAAYKKDSSTGHKQLGKTILKAGGAAAGFALGTKIGALFGSVIPGAGTIAGGIIGGLIGLATSGAMMWLGRETGKLAGDVLIDDNDLGAMAMADSIEKTKTEEQMTSAVETVTWAKENQDKLTSSQKTAIAKLEQNLQALGYLQAEQAEVATD